MRILIDTNVLLDVALNREPFAAQSAQVVDWAQAYPGAAAVAWHTVSNFDYLTKGKSRDFLADLLAFTDVAAGDAAMVRQALTMPTPDFEDALQVAAALTFQAQYIVTRNVRDYKKLAVPAITPTQFNAL
jgi:predicted nucleic acid-binding protein